MKLKQKNPYKNKAKKPSIKAKIMFAALLVFFGYPVVKPVDNAEALTLASLQSAEPYIFNANSDLTKQSAIPITFNGLITKQSVTIQNFADNCSVKSDTITISSNLTPRLQDAGFLGDIGNYVQDPFKLNPSLDSGCVNLVVAQAYQDQNLNIANQGWDSSLAIQVSPRIVVFNIKAVDEPTTELKISFSNNNNNLENNNSSKLIIEKQNLLTQNTSLDSSLNLNHFEVLRC